MLVPLTEVLGPARDRGRGLGAFNVIHLEHAEALVGAAEDVGLPVVLQISENTVAWHGSLAPLAAATRTLAERASVPVVLHLDHAVSVDLVRESLDLGFTSVMFDGSTLDDAANRSTTREVVSLCHERGVDVEAELGEIGGKDGVHAPGVRTDPVEAQRFALDTGVDALAVAVGSSHAMTERTAALDLELVVAIRAAVPVPLVLHGSSGVPDDGLVAGVRAGMTKVNIATHLSSVFTGAVRHHLESDARLVDSRRYLGPARSAMRAEAARLLELLALR
ncbi:fructose-bisphosphate aldolase [Phycicoccus sp. Root563]|uniref:class II fructose-bisphosphate aldolase n=1 Tax=Phycicoccus sp. Root563 TaxID=1736562 RepID=UPI000702C963|nr:class II fructose-bisphosphate aldolase [Phycicoccus sp. Root563]KQZ88990.1 fructose-bisphosphate aldolase [Phycicoccus sp. Root563]